MATTTHLRHQPHRLLSGVLVLIGVATVVGACNSGRATADDLDPLGIAAQAASEWRGGCACVPMSSCSLSGTPCVRAPSASDGCSSTLILCKTGTYCYVAADGTMCSSGEIGKSTCDGGYCGTCPGCKTSSGLCQAGDSLTACGTSGNDCKNCNDANECTSDSCTSRGTCSNQAVSDGTSCSSGAGRCFGGKCCTGCELNGSCQTGAGLEACGAAGGECKACEKPSNVCLRALCSAGACSTLPVDAGTTCSDGNVCNGEETCDGNGSCQQGTEKKCESSDPCLIGSCDPVQGCVYAPNTGVKCSDGNACTVGDLCDASGKCVGSSNKNCNDGNSCTTDSCDAASGNCVFSPVTDGQTCTDGITCAPSGTCQKGHCTEGNISCDDGNICTTDSLDCTSKTCSHKPVTAATACVPKDKCFYNGTCNAGDCVGDTPVNCDDGNPCTADSCDPATGCVHTNEALTTPCVDGNPCTTDDRCRIGGRCQGTPIVCAALDECHSAGLCDEKTGRCGSDPRKDDGSPCANGTGTCQGGSCQANATGGAAGAAGVAGAAGEIGEVANAGTAGTAGTAGAAPTNTVQSAGSAATEIAQGGSVSASGAPAALAGAGINESDYFKRNPGGCNCSLPSGTSRRGYAWLGLVAALVGLGRRRRPLP